MAMNQPVPPEQQSMEAAAAPQPEVAPEAAAPVEAQAAPAAEGQPAVDPAQEQQVIQEVAQGLEDEEISAMDIMAAVLMDSLGLSQKGATSLVNILLQDLVDDAAAEEVQPPMEAAPTDVPPEV